MVELRLESVQDAGMPKECYISVRVGDTQKLSKLHAARSYKFPQAGDRRFGKIEVFQRIGAASVDLDPEAGGKEVTINCIDAGFGSLSLKIAMEAHCSELSHAKFLEEEKAAQALKVRAAKDYLSKHSLEVRLSEAMQAVIREKPEDPLDFLAAKLVAGRNTVRLPPLRKLSAGAGEMTASLGPPPLPQAPPHRLEPLAPKAYNEDEDPHVLKHAPPQAQELSERLKPTILPFAAYYSSAFLSVGPATLGAIYLRFPAFVQGCQKAVAGDCKPTRQAAVQIAHVKAHPVAFKDFSPSAFRVLDRDGLRAIYGRFPTFVEATGKAKPAVQARTPLRWRPSVGTWLTKPCPLAQRGAIAAARPPARRLDAGANALQKAVAFPQKPSVGTWLTRPQRLAPAAGTTVLPAASVAGTKGVLAKEGKAAAFALKPSVGTWLMPAAKKQRFATKASNITVVPVRTPAQLAVMPSAGTWLCRPPQLRRPAHETRS